MEQQKQITKNQHYIPQSYFREFSESKKGIYRHNVQVPDEDSVLVSIRNQCSKKYLYEMINEDEELIEPNKLENFLAQFDINFSNTIKSIKYKAFNKSNYNTSSFLTQDEKENLIIFICIQLLRFPEMIRYGQEVAKEVYNNEINDIQAKNIAIEMYYNSLFRLKNNQERPNIALPVLKWFEHMAFKIGVSDSDDIITCDLPMCFYNNKGLYPFEETPDQVTVPLTSRIVLYLSPFESERIGKRNILFPLDPEDIIEEHTAMFTTARRWIYSYSPLSHDDILKLAEDRRFIDKKKSKELL